MIGQHVAAALPLALIRGIESGAWDAKLVQRVLGRKMRLLDQLDDLGLPRTQEISCLVLPIHVHVFGRPVLHRKVGHHFFQRRRLTTQILHRARSCRTCRAARQAMSTGPEELLGPAMYIEAATPRPAEP
ncbi:hypothetical protein BCCGELA001_30805 [Bradyrhizobium sp. CCGE-LA001]|nr:hypothetical protein BCCGELA001_30805 [Bradyrhizobium sp. CCGE-LA001]